MSTPVLATKLYIPSRRSQAVPRPHLLERLNKGVHRKLTLISAPAGFGKTTLVATWLGTCERPVAWLSLDENDREPSRFLTYLIAALQTIWAHFGDSTLSLLHASQATVTEAVLSGLLNEISHIQDEFILVLDDYHTIDDESVDSTLVFLLEYLPPQMHVVITTREDPGLPLPRWRARGQMTELRAADLRFTVDEAATFLNQVMDLDLTAEDVVSLENRTEGWIAGLQLAALALQGTAALRHREDASGFIKAFAGDNRYIVDYLVEEVLQRQPEHIRSFLLQTSILDRLHGPLCDAVRSFDGIGTGQADGRTLLETLERGNLFVVPLDGKRQWYRYHHLFRDVLHAHLLQEQPDLVRVLHQRASKWFNEEHSPADAFRHALAAGDVRRAGDVAELAWAAMDRNRQSATWMRWVQALPDDLIRARPVLSAGYAWAHLDSGNLEAAEARLRDAERWLDSPMKPGEPSVGPAGEMVVVDEEEFRLLPATVSSARAYLALAHGDVASTVDHAQRALGLLPEADYLRRGIAASLLALAYWTTADLEAAYHSFSSAMASFEKAGNILFAITGTYVLADIRLAQGRLHDAIRTYEQALQLVAAQGESPFRGTADLYLGLSELQREQGDLQAAAESLRKSEELSEQAALPRFQYRWCLAQARTRQTEGELDTALELLEKAERLYLRGPVPDIRPIAALKAQVRMAQGRMSEAFAWVRTAGLSVTDNLSYTREFEHMTLARLLIARYRREQAEEDIDEALSLLERLLQAAETGERTGSMIDILVLQALAFAASGNRSRALTPLARALALGEPQGYVRVFVDEGKPMAELLAAASAKGIMPEYTSRLLAAGGEAGSRGTTIPAAASAQPLIEPLSERELEVLQLVAQGLTNREIGERLFIALDTVKGHNRKIYGKLQVRRRTEAVARAQELGLL